MTSPAQARTAAPFVSGSYDALSAKQPTDRGHRRLFPNEKLPPRNAWTGAEGNGGPTEPPVVCDSLQSCYYLNLESGSRELLAQHGLARAMLCHSRS